MTHPTDRSTSRQVLTLSLGEGQMLDDQALECMAGGVIAVDVSERNIRNETLLELLDSYNDQAARLRRDVMTGPVASIKDIERLLR